jgi:hypothetical protein
VRSSGTKLFLPPAKAGKTMTKPMDNSIKDMNELNGDFKAIRLQHPSYSIYLLFYADKLSRTVNYELML